MAATVTTATAPPSIWMVILLAIIGSGLLATIIGAIMTNLRSNAEARRDRYAQAVRYLVAWAEYPYRIRRRVDDEPATLAALAELGHHLQEQLAESRAWIAAESRAVGEVYTECIRAAKATIGPACSAAWKSAPVDGPAGMVLGDLKTGAPEDMIVRLQGAISYRFGIKRLMWREFVKLRLNKLFPVEPMAATKHINQ
jgi:hypothetical protein